MEGSFRINVSQYSGSYISVEDRAVGTFLSDSGIEAMLQLSNPASPLPHSLLALFQVSALLALGNFVSRDILYLHSISHTLNESARLYYASIKDWPLRFVVVNAES